MKASLGWVCLPIEPFCSSSSVALCLAFRALVYPHHRKPCKSHGSLRCATLSRGWWEARATSSRKAKYCKRLAPETFPSHVSDESSQARSFRDPNIHDDDSDRPPAEQRGQFHTVAGHYPIILCRKNRNAALLYYSVAFIMQ
jgi:hypothetical protein